MYIKFIFYANELFVVAVAVVLLREIVCCEANGNGTLIERNYGRAISMLYEHFMSIRCHYSRFI